MLVFLDLPAAEPGFLEDMPWFSVLNTKTPHNPFVPTCATLLFALGRKKIVEQSGEMSQRQACLLSWLVLFS